MFGLLSSGPNKMDCLGRQDERVLHETCRVPVRYDWVPNELWVLAGVAPRKFSQPFQVSRISIVVAIQLNDRAAFLQTKDKLNEENNAEHLRPGLDWTGRGAATGEFKRHHLLVYRLPLM